MDLTEVTSWAYGKWFPGQPVFGFLVIGGIPLLVIGVVFYVIWMMGVDKYEARHYSKTQSATPEGLATSPTSSVDPTDKSSVPALLIEKSEGVSIRDSIAIGDGPHIAVKDSKDVKMEDILTIKPKEEKSLDRPH